MRRVVARATAAIRDPAATAQAEQILVEAAARGVGIGELRQLGEEIAYRAGPDAAEEWERRRWEKRHLSFGLTFGGAGVLSGACGDTVSLEIVRTAAEAFAPPGGACDIRTAAQRRMDGLVTACKTALDTARAPERHGTAPHVSILVRDETLAQAAGAPPARTGHGAMLTARQVLALCCGARLTAIRWQDGLPLDVGRTARTESPAIRRALEARDLTCRWPGCDTPGLWCTGHHIGGWRSGASTCLAGIVLLCHLHHAYFIHLIGWTITGDPNNTLCSHHPGRILTLASPLPGKPAPRDRTRTWVSRFARRLCRAQPKPSSQPSHRRHPAGPASPTCPPSADRRLTPANYRFCRTPVREAHVTEFVRPPA